MPREADGMMGEFRKTVSHGKRPSWERVLAFGPGREFETEAAAREAAAAWQPDVDEVTEAMRALVALDERRGRAFAGGSVTHTHRPGREGGNDDRRKRASSGAFVKAIACTFVGLDDLPPEHRTTAGFVGVLDELLADLPNVPGGPAMQDQVKVLREMLERAMNKARLNRKQLQETPLTLCCQGAPAVHRGPDHRAGPARGPAVRGAAVAASIPAGGGQSDDVGLSLGRGGGKTIAAGLRRRRTRGAAVAASIPVLTERGRAASRTTLGCPSVAAAARRLRPDSGDAAPAVGGVRLTCRIPSGDAPAVTAARRPRSKAIASDSLAVAATSWPVGRWRGRRRGPPIPNGRASPPAAGARPWTWSSAR